MRTRPRDAGAGGGPLGAGGQRALTLWETTVVLGLVSLAVLAAVPRVLEARRSMIAASAAREIGTVFRGLRYRAVSEGRHYGVLFENTGEGWSWAVYRDGDGDGMRTDDILKGRDERVEGPWSVRGRWSGTELGVPVAAPAVGPPPSLDDIGDGDPVRFGRSDLVSFSPKGTSSSGTLYLRSGERSWAVVLYGRSVRVRFWERRGKEWVAR